MIQWKHRQIIKTFGVGARRAKLAEALKRQPCLKIFYRCYSTLRGSCSYHCDVVTVLICLKYEANISANTPLRRPGHRWDQSCLCHETYKPAVRIFKNIVLSAGRCSPNYKLHQLQIRFRDTALLHPTHYAQSTRTNVP